VSSSGNAQVKNTYMYQAVQYSATPEGPHFFAGLQFCVNALCKKICGCSYKRLQHKPRTSSRHATLQIQIHQQRYETSILNPET
jgi:hypothetical protein